MVNKLWGCTTCGNDSFKMTWEEHEKLGCYEKWQAKNEEMWKRWLEEKTNGSDLV